MKILFLSQEGDALGIGAALARSGNEVFFWIRKPGFQKAGVGFVNRVSSWRPHFKKVDLIVADMVGFGSLESVLKGIPALSVNRKMDELELDRGIASETFGKYELEIPESFRYASTQEAQREIGKLDWKEGFVVKPHSNQSTSKTRVVHDPSLLHFALRDVSGPLTVQRIVKGVEVSSEGWFDGERFLTFNHTFEEKRFLTGDLGPMTGCMGNIVLKAEKDKLIRSTLCRLEPFLGESHYRGPVDLNCIVNADHAYVLEITSRMGYDAAEALYEGMKTPFSEFLLDVATGSGQAPVVSDDTMIAVRLTVPKYPYAGAQANEPVGIVSAAMRHIYPTDLYREGTELRTAGTDGVILKAAAIGRRSAVPGAPGREDLVHEARKRVYRTLGGISIESPQYRTDIGVRVNSDYSKLKEWGWLAT